MKNTHVIIMKFSKRVKDIFGMNLSKIILYGSYTRGEQRESSDIDLMILTNLSENEIEKIEPIIYDLACVIIKNEVYFQYWLGALPFYDNVEQEGVVING